MKFETKFIFYRYFKSFLRKWCVTKLMEHHVCLNEIEWHYETYVMITCIICDRDEKRPFRRKKKERKREYRKDVLWETYSALNLCLFCWPFNKSVDRNAVWLRSVKKYYKIQEFPKYAVVVARAEIDDIDGFELLHLHSI